MSGLADIERVLATPETLAFIEVHVRDMQFHALPEDVARDYDMVRLFEVHVVFRNVGRWAVTDGSVHVFTADGERDWEPSPSNRTEKFKRQTRFPLADALRLARQVAEARTWRGMGVAETVAWWRSDPQRAKDAEYFYG